MPTVSIICPLHNKGQYVAETIDSVRAQNVTDWEMIVVENNSMDDGPVQVAQVDDSRVRLIDASTEAHGPGAARNVGLEAARGEWVLFLDADDLIERDYLANLLTRASEVSDAEVIAAPWKEYQANVFRIGIPVIKQPAGFESGGDNLDSYSIAFTCWAVHSAIVKRRRLLQHRWPENLDGFLAEDTAFWFPVVQNARVAYCLEAGALYRTQTDGCRTDFSSAAWFEGNHRAVQENLAWLSRNRQMVKPRQMENLVRLYQELYARALSDHDRTTAWKALREASHWLFRLQESGVALRPSMHLRWMLGVGTFERIRRLVRR